MTQGYDPRNNMPERIQVLMDLQALCNAFRDEDENELIDTLHNEYDATKSIESAIIAVKEILDDRRKTHLDMEDRATLEKRYNAAWYHMGYRHGLQESETLLEILK